MKSVHFENNPMDYAQAMIPKEEELIHDKEK